MSKRQHTLLLGYARRMEQVAKLAAEMNNIEVTYRREFGGEAWDAELQRAMTGERLARLHAELAAERPEPPREFQEDVLTGYGDTAPAAQGSALGLAAAPQELVDVMSEEPIKWGGRS